MYYSTTAYDPAVARFLSPDPYVQDPSNPQNFNRYSYCLNNPLKYTDPSGEEILTAVIIGAVIGTYMGGTMANNTYNPCKWDYGSGKTWGYMAGGAIVGAASGYVGGVVAYSGMPLANTYSIMAASFTYSIGTSIYTNGQTPVSLSFGAASYNMTDNEWGYLGKKGNKPIENVGYSLGAMANISDVLRGFNTNEVQLQTENTSGEFGVDKIGHSQIVDMDGNSLVDFGPCRGGEFYNFNEGRNNWTEYATNGRITQTKDIPGNIYTAPQIVKGVNLSRLQNYSNRLNTRPGFYNFALRSCSLQAARGLTLSGVPVFGIHPYFLRFQIAAGLRIYSYSYYLNFKY